MNPSVEAAQGSSWLAFLAWFLVGAAYVLGFLGIMTIGVPVLLAAVAGTIALSLSHRGRHGVFGLVSGLAGPLFYVALLNRAGPGEVCATTGEVTTCIQEWSPWPWVVIGIALLVAGWVLFRRQQQAPARHPLV